MWWYTNTHDYIIHLCNSFPSIAQSDQYQIIELLLLRYVCLDTANDLLWRWLLLLTKSNEWSIIRIHTCIEKHVERYERVVKMWRKELLAATSTQLVVTIARIHHRVLVLHGLHQNGRERQRERGRKGDSAKEFHTLHCLDKIKQERRKTGSNCWCGDSW